MTKFHEEKKRLLLDLKQETLHQLEAVKAEDPEKFLKSTDLCNKHIGSYNALEIHSGESTGPLAEELTQILIEISRIREEISGLASPLYEKLRKKSFTEKKINKAKHQYKNDELPLPSVFMDKKI
ncbi:hypothetical protein HPT25_18675 [Bacillus sp. BRMEA1]|uniref:hypothetical protein n=1 Tax=Neobacillus endophyticus TaxID=2738405 RepID=UPI00156575C3|nr:hypothetical protein [Neobacillus endophyticus]NRD79390.1 hypothetical protein [Neobacillus endophyticus]